MVICTSLSLIGCDKEEIDAPITPPIEKPDEPIASPSTNDIIKIKTGDIDMIIGTNNWQGVTYGNGRYVAVGYGGYIAYSTDGINWTSKIVGLITWAGGAYGNGKYVVIGNNVYIAYSTDDINWIMKG